MTALHAVHRDWRRGMLAGDIGPALHAANVATDWHRGTLTGHAAAALLRKSREVRQGLAMPIHLVAPCLGRHADTLSAPLSVVGRIPSPTVMSYLSRVSA